MKKPSLFLEGDDDLKEFTRKDLELLLANIDKLSDEEVLELEAIAEVLEHREYAKQCQDDLLSFCKHMQQDYKVGTHHKLLADLLMDIEKGTKDRVTVSIAPRHGKSQLTSIFFTAWYLGKNPTHKVMLVSHTADLAVTFGRKVRNLIASEAYQDIFPGVALAADSKSAGRWDTNAGGEFYATGVGSSIAGRGAHLLVVDDPHSEQDLLAGNFSAFEETYKWFTTGARTRLMKGGRVAVVATRWHQADLIGKLVKQAAMNPDADQYEVVEFPAILNENTPEEKALWPEFFNLEALHRTRASMPLFQWNAQYQQCPTGETASIIKRDWWNEWPDEEPPECEYLIMTLDAAAELNNRADFTAIQVWGVFFNDKTDRHELILINAITERVEFPELKALAKREYDRWQPDAFIVEKKSSGVALYQELRRTGMSINEYTPARGTANSPNNKMARLNAVADMIKDGLVWAPQTRWAEAVVEEVASFPFGEHDDNVDCMIMALMRFRSGGFVRLSTDEPDEPQWFKGNRRGGYY